MTEPLLELVDASLGYGESVVLHDVDFTVSRGEFVAVVGPNGSGKSTLVKALLGLATRFRGELSLFGTPDAGFRQLWRVGYVPQRHTTGGPIPATVHEVVTSGRLPRARWFLPLRAGDRHAVTEAMQRVGIEHLRHRPVGELSGGQQRRVLIARALASETELLILDEPTAGVDVEAQAALAEILGSLAQTGSTIVLVTHDLSPFESLLTRVVWVSRGRIEYDGPPTEAVLAATAEPFAHHDDDERRRPGVPPDLGSLG
jgi:zinc transport system ATP-binding protein